MTFEGLFTRLITAGLLADPQETGYIIINRRQANIQPRYNVTYIKASKHIYGHLSYCKLITNYNEKFRCNTMASWEMNHWL